MGGEQRQKRIKVTFHDPNEQGETAKYLIELIAESLANYINDKNTLLTRTEAFEALSQNKPYQ